MYFVASYIPRWNSTRLLIFVLWFNRARLNRVLQQRNLRLSGIAFVLWELEMYFVVV